MIARRILLLGFLALWLLPGHPAEDTVIGWYNGEWQQGIPGLANWYLGPDRFSRVYDQFEVPEPGWTVVGVFSDNGLYEFPPVTHAYWEVRRGMSPKHGGKVVAKGVARATQEHASAARGAAQYRVQVDGLRVHLPAGRYWLSVAPVGEGQAFLNATIGRNAIGAHEGLTLFHDGHKRKFRPVEEVGDAGQMGVCKHFAQGVLIAK